MRLYIVDNIPYLDPDRKIPLRNFSIKRGDTIKIIVSLWEFGYSVTPSDVGFLGLKIKGDYDGDYLLQTGGISKNQADGKAWEFEFPVYSKKLDDALNVNTNSEDDIISIPANIEFLWFENETYKISASQEVEILNNINRPEGGLPIWIDNVDVVMRLESAKEIVSKLAEKVTTDTEYVSKNKEEIVNAVIDVQEIEIKILEITKSAELITATQANIATEKASIATNQADIAIKESQKAAASEGKSLVYAQESAEKMGYCEEAKMDAIGAAEEAGEFSRMSKDFSDAAKEKSQESAKSAELANEKANLAKNESSSAKISAEYAISAATRAQNAAEGAEDVIALSAKTDAANIFSLPQTFNAGAIKNIAASTNTDVTNWSDVTRAVALSGIYNCSFRGMAKSAGTCASWINTADKILKLNPFATTQSYLAPNVSGFYALSSDCISVELPLRYYNFGEFSPVNGDNEICIKIRIVNRTGPMLYGISMTTDETQITWHPEHPKTIKTAPFTTTNEFGVIHYWCKSSPLECDIVGTEYCGLIEPDGTKQIFDATKAGHGWAYIDQRGVEDNFYIIIRRGFIEFWLRGFSGPGGREVSMSKYKPVFLGKVANFKSPGPTFGYRLFLTGYLPAAFDDDSKQRGGCSLESITIIREGNLSSVFSYQP